MYRILILVAGFAIAIGGLLFLQGGERDPAQLAQVSPNLDETPVTAVADMSAPTNTPAPAAAPAIDMSALSAAVQASVDPKPAPAPTEPPTELAAMTTGVLADLGIKPGSEEEAAMQDITQAVLASLTGSGAAPATREDLRMGLKDLIAQSMRSGQGDAYIDALLSEAVTSGGAPVPQAIAASDGSLDTKALLASIVTQSMGSAQGDDIAAIAAEAGASSAPKPTAQPRVETVSASGDRFYVVEKGDSLAYISLLFYQDTSKFERIFEANRDRISSPNMIRVGQKLRIPG